MTGDRGPGTGDRGPDAEDLGPGTRDRAPGAAQTLKINNKLKKSSFAKDWVFGSLKLWVDL